MKKEKDRGKEWERERGMKRKRRECSNATSHLLLWFRGNVRIIFQKEEKNALNDGKADINRSYCLVVSLDVKSTWFVCLIEIEYKLFYSWWWWWSFSVQFDSIFMRMNRHQINDWMIFSIKHEGMHFEVVCVTSIKRMHRDRD